MSVGTQKKESWWERRVPRCVVTFDSNNSIHQKKKTKERNVGRRERKKTTSILEDFI
jgi:hypothetical protein